jgi:hypothetical protein
MSQFWRCGKVIAKPKVTNQNHGNGKGVIVKLKEYECVQVGHHRDVGKVIEEWQKKGWRLHAYQATQYRMDVNHYLLFEKGE